IFAEGNVVLALDRHRPAPTYCSGIQVLNPALINRITRDEGDFTALWRQLISQRRLMVSSVKPHRWFSVDTMADLKRARG
ncbi:MAG TPA: NDP-sugar synthase, partial [Polyangia bacterium]